MTQNNLIDFKRIDSQPPEVVVMELRSEQETCKALQALQERKMVVLKLNRLSFDKAQRVVDWMAGGTHAIDGHTVWIGEQTFLFVPSSIQLAAPKTTVHPVSPRLSRRSSEVNSKKASTKI
ncbi:cell division protein SepF [Candidatus Gracilibacteria bacterium]|jgi:cell division inhibitor SepF|nr:cell division protein SepF [Candidatus Gracilibacteria bacterium]NJM86833.1 cell division protein SepF [Hydrococcus sp. RU_2_2]NJP17866.1 cell division protein SepF [Hydrococcus sp. CRU_1_1]